PPPGTPAHQQAPAPDHPASDQHPTPPATNPTASLLTLHRLTQLGVDLGERLRHLRRGLSQLAQVLGHLPPRVIPLVREIAHHTRQTLMTHRTRDPLAVRVRTLDLAPRPRHHRSRTPH